MMEQIKDTVIIAHRRRKQDYWEGYDERPVAEGKSWIAYFRSLGQIVRVFPGMPEYRADCEKLLEKREAKRKPKMRSRKM